VRMRRQKEISLSVLGSPARWFERKRPANRIYQD
jgi:hypothetical protein